VNKEKIDNETADKILTQLKVVQAIESAKFGIIRAKKHFADNMKEAVQELDDVLEKIIKLQNNGVKKMQKGGEFEL